MVPNGLSIRAGHRHDMYIEIVRRVIEADVKTFARQNGLSVSEVLATIRHHIDNTAAEHYNDEPSIAYEDPLCRLGYLFRHAPANATLFEQVLATSDKVSIRGLYADRWVLKVCAVGGGPGTELLGLAKYLSSRPRLMPSRIEFSVLDNISHWSETWRHLGREIEEFIGSTVTGSRGQAPIIVPAFLSLDVLDVDSYRSYAYEFGEAHIVVCNYLFSENKTRLKEARLAVERLATLTPPGCAFIVIDRRENNPAFQDDVVDLFEAVFGNDIEVETYRGTLDPDEEKTDFGKELTDTLGYPRTKFFTDHHREPTVFWLVAKRGKEVGVR